MSLYKEKTFSIFVLIVLTITPTGEEERLTMLPFVTQFPLGISSLTITTNLNGRHRENSCAINLLYSLTYTSSFRSLSVRQPITPPPPLIYSPPPSSQTHTMAPLRPLTAHERAIYAMNCQGCYFISYVIRVSTSRQITEEEGRRVTEGLYR